jgi:hypothetical protein
VFRASPQTNREERANRTNRGLVEPLAALAALFAVCVGLSTYAVVLAGVDTPTNRDVAGPALATVHDDVTVRGVVDPERLGRAVDGGPTGHRLHVSVRTDGQQWTVGPPAPRHGDRASRRVSVRLGPGRVRAGRLRVVVWQ